MFERPSGGDRAVLVCLDLGEGDPAQRMGELESAGGVAGDRDRSRDGRRLRPDAALFAGKGKVERSPPVGPPVTATSSSSITR
jgi:GTP-binding protein HflX